MIRVSRKENKVSVSVVDYIDNFWDFENEAAAQLSQLAKDENISQVEIYINSFGGDLVPAIALYNTIKAFGENVKTTAVNAGVCASAATLPFVAAKERIVSTGSFFLIHNVFSSAYGNAQDHRAVADDLEKLSVEVLEIYKKELKSDESELKNLMNSEIIITGSQAQKIFGTTENTGKFSTGIFQNSANIMKIFQNAFTFDLKKENESLKMSGDLSKYKSNIEQHLKFLDVSPDMVARNIRENKEFNADVAIAYKDCEAAQIRAKQEANNNTVIPTINESENEKKAVSHIEFCRNIGLLKK